MSKALNGGIVFSLVIFLCVYAVVYAADYGGGQGTAEVPYEIYNSQQLNDIGKNPTDWDKHFVLMANINLAGLQENFAIIAPEFNKPFTGSFDGNNHSISNLYITDVEVSYVAMFGNVASEKAMIENLTLIDPVIDSESGYGMGSVVGLLKQGRIYNCKVIDADISGINNVGGLVGQCYGRIEFCTSNGQVTGQDRVGGISGSAGDTAEIKNCGSSADVSGKRQLGGFAGSNNGQINACVATGGVSGATTDGMANVGGFVGTNFGLITNCYSTGSVSGFTQVGGFCGTNSGTDDFVKTIQDCYSTGAVSSIGHSGAFTSRDTMLPDGQFIQCFWDIDTSGRNNDDFATGLATAQMQDPDIFIQAGWNFQKAWRACKVFADYPRLFWEETGCPRYNGGNGSPDDPYILSEQQEFILFTNNQFDWDKHFVLMTDIDLDSIVYTGAVICPDTDSARQGFQGFSFDGSFNGNGYTISNAMIDATASEADYLGIFGKIGTGGEVLNLNVDNIIINGSLESANIGSLAGCNEGKIIHCKSTNSDIGGFNAIGGLVGSNYGDMSHSSAASVVDGITSVGGFAGRNFGSITGSFSNCLVSASATAGGFVGYDDDGMITDCYTLGSVFADNFVGGFAGYCNYASIARCYSACVVWGTYSRDGFAGYLYHSNINTCFWDVETSGMLNGNGAVGLTTSEMMNRQSYSQWDFTGNEDGIYDNWRLCIDGADYPGLAWEYSEYGDFACPDSVAMEDISVFVDSWLQGTIQEQHGDANFDNKVNLSDFAVIAENWLN